MTERQKLALERRAAATREIHVKRQQFFTAGTHESEDYDLNRDGNRGRDRGIKRNRDMGSEKGIEREKALKENDEPTRESEKEREQIKVGISFS